MKRRAFLLAAAALAAPHGFAQKAGTRRIGFLSFLGPDSDSTRRYMPVFRDALRRFGYEEGRNLAIEFRWAEGKLERLGPLAEYLVRLNVELIVASTNDPIAAARQATRSIPIVMMTAATPVELGFVESLARPGGNVTGTVWNAPDTAGKLLQVLKEAVPRAARVALLWNPAFPGMQSYGAHVDRAAGALGISVQYFEATRAEHIGPALERIAAIRPDALYFVYEPVTATRLRDTAAFAIERRLVSVGTAPQWVDAGGLLYYGPDVLHAIERTAAYVDRILRGAKPADLPVELPTKYELVINAKTARAIGYSPPAALLARADRVIQ